MHHEAKGGWFQRSRNCVFMGDGEAKRAFFRFTVPAWHCRICGSMPALRTCRNTVGLERTSSETGGGSALRSVISERQCDSEFANSLLEGGTLHSKMSPDNWLKSDNRAPPLISLEDSHLPCSSLVTDSTAINWITGHSLRSTPLKPPSNNQATPRSRGLVRP